VVEYRSLFLRAEVKLLAVSSSIMSCCTSGGVKGQGFKGSVLKAYSWFDFYLEPLAGLWV
jgi:hypothetical protein